MSTDTVAADLAVAELLTTAGLADPYTRMERIRALGRAVPSTMGRIVTGYDDCQHALRNGNLISDPDRTFEPLLGTGWRENRALKLLGESLLFLEGPQHHRVRKLATHAFTPAAVASWQPTIDTVVNDLLNNVARRLQNSEPVDLVECLARPLPIAIMAELIGLPRADAARLRHLIGKVADLNVGIAIDEDALLEAHQIGIELESYLRTALETQDTETPEKPARHVMGRIALDTSEDITIEDRVSLAFILLAAGFETTAMLVANAIALLHDQQHEWTQLVLDPNRAARVVEETLRLQTPATFTSRTVRAHTTVSDEAVEPGEQITMFLAAANRDPQKFTDPTRFMPDRYADSTSASAPLSFGSGVHHCIGSLLARTEAVAVLRRINMLGPVGQLVLDEPVSWRPAAALRGVDRLVVKRVTTPAKPTTPAKLASSNGTRPPAPAPAPVLPTNAKA